MNWLEWPMGGGRIMEVKLPCTGSSSSKGGGGGGGGGVNSEQGVTAWQYGIQCTCT